MIGNKNIKPFLLDINTSVLKAKKLWSKEKYDFCIVCSKHVFKGLLFFEDIDNELNDKQLIDLKDRLKPIYLAEDYTLFEWLKVITKHHLDKIPLVKANDLSFIRIIDNNEILETFKVSGLLAEHSSVIVLSKASEDFRYSEIFQIAEANNVKIIASYISNSTQDETQIVLNTLHVGLNELLQNYRRYEYDIISLHEEDKYAEILQANSDYFSKYLTV